MDNNYEKYSGEEAIDIMDIYDEEFNYEEYERDEKEAYEEYKKRLTELNIGKFASYELTAELESMPARFWTQEIAELWIQKSPGMILNVPMSLRNEQLWELALSTSGMLLEYVPQEMRNERLFEVAVSQNSDALEFIPEELRTEKLYEIAILQDSEWVYVIPEDKKNDKIRQIEKEIRDKAEAERKEEEFQSEIEDFKNKYLHSEATLEDVRDEVRMAKEKLEKLEKMLQEHGIDIFNEREGTEHE